MPKAIKTHTGVHEAQAAHDPKDCKINERPHNHPETDCGHYVPEGPGVPNPPHNDEQDAEHGPGVRH